MFQHFSSCSYPGGTIRLTILGLSLHCLLTGCSKTTPKPSENVAEQAQVSAVDECRRKLSSAIQRIQPESMATQTRRELVVNSLNTWLASCAETDVEKLKISELNAAALTPVSLRTASAVRFSENDIVYVRDCLLLKALTESIWKRSNQNASAEAASDRKRVVQLFRHLIRNLSLLPPDDNRVPVGLYEALLTGRGTVDDRIWVFAESLRQRQLDVILLKAATPGDPAAEELSNAADVLMGVVVDNQLMLFDPQRGTAMPKSGDATPLTEDPAGLEAIANIDRWKSASVYVICHPSAVAPRMMILQERLEATDSAVLYEELAGGTSEIRPLRDRLAEVIGTVWPAEALKVWEVPEQRIAAASALTEEQKQALMMLLRPFDGPFERESINIDKLLTDPNINEAELSVEERLNLKLQALDKLMERSDDLFGKPSRRLLLARLGQVMGNFGDDVIQDLQQIRIASLQEKIELQVPVDAKQAAVIPFKLPQTILDVQKSAVGDTLYWTGMSQMSRDDMGAAIQTLRNHRRHYTNEKTVFEPLMNEAEALIQIGNPAAAAEALKEANVEGNPDRPRAQWLLARLTAAGLATTPSVDPGNAADPATPAENVPATEEPKDAPAADPASAPADSKSEASQ